MALSNSVRVTIALPVYNGAALVSRAIEAALNQSFSGFELLISDNCSTDGTAEICRSYAQRDARIVYTATERNIGAAGNLRRLARLARGQYFKWLCHDDSMDPDFVEKCLAVAEASEDIITVMPLVDVVDHQGTRLQTVSSYTGRSQWSSDRLEQYRQMMDELSYCETHDNGLLMVACIYGLHRTELLLRTRLVLPFLSSDYVFAAEAALFGQIVQVDNTRGQFTVSTSPTSTSANFAAWNPVAIQRMLSPSSATRIGTLLSARRRHIEHVIAVLRSPLSPPDKLLALEAATRPTRARLAARRARSAGRSRSPGAAPGATS